MNKSNDKELVFQTQNIIKEIHSPDKSKILIISYVEDMNPKKEFRYKVVSAKNKEKLISGSFIGIKMEWLTNTSLKAYLYQGIIEVQNLQENYKIIKL